MKVFVDAIGIIGPGFTGWLQTSAILAGREAYVPAPSAKPGAELLPAVERRRTSAAIRLALTAGHEAVLSSGYTDYASVFTSSGGSGEVVDQICQTLAADRQVSPTHFHNSVHNAAAGYWGIATRSHHASTSLCAHDGSFAAGLLEAASQSINGAVPVLLIAFDLPYPPPLYAVRPIAESYGVGMMLSRVRSARSMACLEIDFAAGGASDEMALGTLEHLRRNNPAARSLPLLQRIAQASAARVTLDYLSDCKVVCTVSPA